MSKLKKLEKRKTVLRERINHLGIELGKVENEIKKLAPPFPEGIRDKNDLIVGRWYKEINRTFGCTGSWRFLGFRQKGWINIEKYYNNGELIKDVESLADLGITPYDSGAWNDTNYTIRIEGEELCEIIREFNKKNCCCPCCMPFCCPLIKSTK